MKNGVLTVFFLLAGAWVLGQATGPLEEVESGMTLYLSAPILPGGERKFYLNVQTNEVYECANYILEQDVKVAGSKIVSKVAGVRRVEPCSPGMGPAVGPIDLTRLKRGKYKVRFIIHRQFFNARLTVDSTSYAFEIPNADPLLLRIYNGHLNIIPDGTVWGKCEYTEPKHKLVAQEFMGALEKAGAVKTQLPVGDYGEFYLHQVGVTEQKTVQGNRFEYPFVYRWSGDLVVLQEVMGRYKDKLRITLKNTEGKVLYN